MGRICEEECFCLEVNSYFLYIWILGQHELLTMVELYIMTKALNQMPEIAQ